MTMLPTLTSDCSQCAALCCTVLAFEKGEDFAIDKPSGTPCPQLARNHRCTRHDTLKDDGMHGCIAYECAGAGQRVVQERYNGESWRDDPGLLAGMARDFARLKPLHERMVQLTEAAAFSLPEILESERTALLARHARLWSDMPQLSARFDAFVQGLKDAGH